MILHIDMDAFFASVEQRDRPACRNRPLVVGGDSKRGVVAAASYEARAYGIHSAMPLYRAKELCPALVVLPPDKDKYKSASGKIMKTIMAYSPLFEQISVDEAYIDTAGCTKLFGSPGNTAVRIKNDIRDNFSLTCSIGVAPLKFLAKIASDINKPDGLFIVESAEARQFARDIPIKKIPGVGKKALNQMKALNIKTLGDVRKFPPSVLEKTFGRFGETLMQYANCIDTSGIGKFEPQKSVSSESTFPSDTLEFEEIKRCLLMHAETVARQLRKKEMSFQNLFVKIKFSDFTQVTRQKKAFQPRFSSRSIFNEALQLVREIPLTQKVRLVGVGVSDFIKKGAAVQLEIRSQNQEKQAEKWDTVDRTLDAISEKFGSRIVKNACLNR